MRGFTRDDALPVFITACWGFNYIAVKFALREVDPLALALLRNVGSLFAIIAVFYVVKQAWTFRRADLLRFTLIGLVGITVNQLAFNSGIALTTATNTGLLITTSPIFGLILSAALDRERIRRRRWVGVAVGLAGTALIVTGSQHAASFGQGGVTGDLLVLTAALTFALYSVLGRPILKVYSPLLVTLYGFLFGSPLLIPTGIVPLLHATISLETWLVVTYLVVSNSLLTVAWYFAIQRLGASRTLTYMYLVPLFAALFAMALLGEQVTALQLVGAVIMLVGVNMARSA